MNDLPSNGKPKRYWTIRQDSLPNKGEYYPIWKRFVSELIFRLEAMENEERKIIYFDIDKLAFRKRKLG